MTFIDFIKYKAVVLCFECIGIVILSAIFTIVLSIEFAVTSAIFLLLFFAICLFAEFLREKKRLRTLNNLIDVLPQKYLAAEILPKPFGPVEFGYYQVIKEISKSAIGTVEQAEREKYEYQDYVERWLHELKTPLTACELILDNGGDNRKLREELKRAENLTENILYYARLRSPEKDIKISNFNIKDAADKAVKSQMSLLIAAGISVDVVGECTVYSDSKALEFIIRQLLTNCAKYCQGCHIDITIKDHEIEFKDNGVGIPSHEIARVTERGFTGTNGRLRGDSTGMGLYIVSGLCMQLGIDMEILSKQGEYTQVVLTFPYKNVRKNHN